MKVVFATGMYPPAIGGPATYTATMVRELTRRGVMVRVVTYGDKQTLQDRGVPFFIVTRNRFKSVQYFRYARAVIRCARDADIIYAQDPVSAGLPAALAAFILRKPFLLKIVGDYAWEQSGTRDLLDDFLTRSYGFRVSILRAIERWVASRARIVIVPSQYLRSIVIRWGIHEDQIVVVPNGVEPFVSASREDARSKFVLHGNVILSVGRLVWWKGFHTLIRAARALKNVTVVIVGDGPERTSLEKEAVGVPVHFIGASDKKTLAEYFAAADIFVLNTAYEGFSHQLLEVMAAGVPVITTSAGGNREIVRHEQNALNIEYDDERALAEAVERLIKDESLGDTLSKNARIDSSKYTVSRMVDETMEIFNQVYS
ncbi:MAG: glycosyltransferase family 4 protein [Patescibacteria group bacterium]